MVSAEARLEVSNISLDVFNGRYIWQAPFHIRAYIRISVTGHLGVNQLIYPFNLKSNLS